MPELKCNQICGDFYDQRRYFYRYVILQWRRYVKIYGEKKKINIRLGDRFLKADN